ncbi:MAG TPA: hypothetical protein DDY98_00565, partial [Ruminococcaceae bacterium]|nr:hypothetical protein [Oscillospiraceae bacterium]
MKRFIQNNAVLLGIFAVTLMMAVVTLLHNQTVGIIGLAILTALVLLSVVSNVFTVDKTQKLLTELDRQIDEVDQKKLNSFPMPMLVCSDKGVIRWYNTLFKSQIIGDIRLNSDEVSPFLNGKSVDEFQTHAQLYTCVAGRFYSVYGFSFHANGEKCYALLFSDETDLRRTAYEFQVTRPWVLLISIDNLEEIMSGYADSDSDSMRSKAEKLIDQWLSEYGCLVRKLGDGRFVVV